MSAVLFYLLHNPEWLARATEEVRSAFTSDEDILLGPPLSSCKVLIACIDESQRLTPTAPNGPPRVADAGGIMIDGHFLPQGTTVNSPIYHLQREEAFFESPHRFQPNRWMIDERTAAEDEERIKHQQMVFMPFHIGPRSCKLKHPYLQCSSRQAPALQILCSPLHSSTQIANIRYDQALAGG